VFQGRYKAVLVDKDSYLLELCRYIVLNPVRAGRGKKPEDWTWSSYRATAGFTRVPDFLTVDWILSQFAKTKQRGQGLYRAFVREGMTGGSPWRDLRGQIFLGDERFVERSKGVLGEKNDLDEIPRIQRYANRPQLSELLGVGVISSKRQRDEAIHEAHVRYGYTLKQIADTLGLHYTTVSKVVREIEKQN